MPKYYSKFPKINYKFADGTEKELTDLNIKFSLSSDSNKTSELFYKFSYRDTDRPDSLAEKYYSSSDYYWLILASNNIFDMNHELPMPESVFNSYLIEKYKEFSITPDIGGVFDYVTSTVHHYEDGDGYIIDFDTFQSVGDTKEVTIYDYEFSENEKKRNIRVIEDDRAKQVKNELEDKLRDIRADSV